MMAGWGWSTENTVQFSDLSAQEQLGQTLTVFVDVDSAEQFRSVILLHQEH